MDDDKTDKAAQETAQSASPESGPKPGKSRKRPPPTIELKAASVTDAPVEDAVSRDASPADDAPRPESESHSPETAAAGGSEDESPARKAAPISLLPILAASAAGAVAACLVMAAAWFAMSPGGKSDRTISSLPQAAIKSDLDTLDARIAKIEARPVTTAPPAADPAVNAAVTARIETLEKSVGALRDDLVSARSALDALKSAPREAAAPDLSGVEERIAKIERATVALTGEIAAPPKPAPEDPRMRLVAVATALDSSVRQSEPYAQTLAAARSLAGDMAALKPLDAFADKGVPTANTLNKELLGLLPQLAPKPVPTPAPAGLMDRLQQSASKLVKVERIDTTATGNSAALARIASAAQRDDLAAARREVNALSASERAPLQAWIAKADAREAALAASKQFASGMTAALAQPARQDSK